MLLYNHPRPAAGLLLKHPHLDLPLSVHLLRHIKLGNVLVADHPKEASCCDGAFADVRYLAGGYDVLH
jgi:hypothetical protein